LSERSRGKQGARQQHTHSSALTSSAPNLTFECHTQDRRYITEGPKIQQKHLPSSVHIQQHLCFDGAALLQILQAHAAEAAASGIVLNSDGTNSPLNSLPTPDFPLSRPAHATLLGSSWDPGTPLHSAAWSRHLFPFWLFRSRPLLACADDSSSSAYLKHTPRPQNSEGAPHAWFCAA